MLNFKIEKLDLWPFFLRSVVLCCMLNFSCALNSQITELKITNVIATVLPGDSLSLDIEYRLEIANSETAKISLQWKTQDVSARFYTLLEGATGDVGEDINAGVAKQIHWEGLRDGELYDVALYANQASSENLISEIIAQIDSTRMMDDLRDIQGIRHRNTGIENLEKTQDLIRTRLASFTDELNEEAFTMGSYEATNFIGHKIGCGQSDDILLVGGHYDTVADSPGADDNGTAIVAMLEVARVLSAYRLEKSIGFVAWDLEEEGLLGSRAFVNNSKDRFGNIEGYFNFEMIGYYSQRPNTQSFPAGFGQIFPQQEQAVADDQFRGNFITNVGNTENSLALMEDFEAITAQYVPELKVISIASPGTGTLVPDLLRSDHAPFWLAGIPALMLTDGADFRNDNYHGPEDVLDSLNFTFMANVVKATVSTLVSKAIPTLCATDNVMVTVSTNSTNTIFDGSSLLVSPNPAYDEITLSLKNQDVLANFEMAIYASNGTLILQKGLASSKSVDVRTLSAGLYHLILHSDVKSYNAKFVIRR